MILIKNQDFGILKEVNNFDYFKKKRIKNEIKKIKKKGERNINYY